MKSLVCVDNVISVNFYKESIQNYYRWVPVTTYLVRKSWYNFWSPKIEISEGGYYHGIETRKIDKIEDYLKEKYNNRFKFVKDSVLNEGPLGTLHQNACVHVKSIGGKYTEDFYTYYNSDEEALNVIENIESTYPGKFMIIK